MHAQTPGSIAGRSTLRSPDTMSTIVLGSQRTQEELLCEGEMEGQGLGLKDVLALHYFGFALANSDDQIEQPDMLHMEAKVPGAEGLIEWAGRVLLRDAANCVPATSFLKYHDGVLNPYEVEHILRPTLDMITTAWQEMAAYRTFETKYEQVTAAMERQVQAMLGKISQDLAHGRISEAAASCRTDATQTWKENKEKEMRADVAEKEERLMGLVEKALPLILSLYELVRGKEQEALKKTYTEAQILQVPMIPEEMTFDEQAFSAEMEDLLHADLDREPAQAQTSPRNP